jgi:branched-subunit amino acid ABC-type transport system permease component
MALGLALVWGVLNIVNLAHGAFIMLGGYACHYLFTLGHIDPFAAISTASGGVKAREYRVLRFYHVRPLPSNHIRNLSALYETVDRWNRNPQVLCCLFYDNARGEEASIR